MTSVAPEELGANVGADGEVLHLPAERVQTKTNQQNNGAKPSRQAVAERVREHLGGEEVTTKTVEEWEKGVAAATTVEDLNNLYPQARTHPKWDSDIKPAFTNRKKQLETDPAPEPEPTPEPEPLPIDGEIVEEGTK